MRPLKHLITPTTSLALVLIMSGCGNDPCQLAAFGDAASGSGGAASFSFSVMEQRGTAVRDSRYVDCVQLSILNSLNYADTLFAKTVRSNVKRVKIMALPAAELDVIIDRKGFFPIKLSSTVLTSGDNVQSERFLLYQSDSGLALPGEFGLTLKPGVQLKDVRELYTGYDEIDIKPTDQPEYFEIKIPFETETIARNDTERLIRRLLFSPFVSDARPLARFSSMIN